MNSSPLTNNNKENGTNMTLKKTNEDLLPKKNILGQSNQQTLAEETETVTLDDELVLRKREIQRNKKSTKQFSIKLNPCY